MLIMIAKIMVIVMAAYKSLRYLRMVAFGSEVPAPSSVPEPLPASSFSTVEWMISCDMFVRTSFHAIVVASVNDAIITPLVSSNMIPDDVV